MATMREEFEAWVSGRGWLMTAWDIWQAAAKAEREACAKACEDQEVHDVGHPGTAFKVQGMCIRRIRARGGE